MPVTTLDISRCVPFLDGQAFGDVGPYQFVEGVAHFAVQPFHTANSAITDVSLAPRNAAGQVCFSAHFAMLQPVSPAQGARKLLVDVVNRGRKRALTYFNSAPASGDPTAPLEAGNGFLMHHGYTVAWCGWQADVPPVPGLMGLQAPEALGSDGQPLTGKILSQFQADEDVSMFYLADRQHLPQAAAALHDPEAQLFVRDHPNAPATVVPRETWSFVQLDGEPDPYYVSLDTGFDAGKIYQLVYNTRGSRLVGLGFAALRDIVSFLKYGTAAAGNPCADTLDYAYAFGISQSGRFLRQYIHLGLNQDESGHQALDGIIPHVAGGMRGEFNLRFGQPSKDVCYIIPELFPFTDTWQTDPVTGQTGSLLGRLEAAGTVPKIIFTNTSAEYWRGDAALIHTDLVGPADAAESAHVRRYHFAGSQHSTGTFPPVVVRASDGIRAQLPFNTVDYTPLLRAVLTNLDRWVRTGEAPPASCHPRIMDGTAVPPETLAEVFATMPGVSFPPRMLQALRLDYGPEVQYGRTLVLPAREGAAYPALVSAIDADGNETAGIRLPDIAVPLATHTGWNLRHAEVGNAALVIGITGGLAGWSLPFASTRAAREASGDPRLSIEERYPSREEYVRQVRGAAQALVHKGYVLEEDLLQIEAEAGKRYDFYVGVQQVG
ncbi:MAG: alpha/beta hydrolase domain-containing protein [Candidatus Tectimicrobiota bacterium]